MADNINWSFISTLEGGQQLDGYVPMGGGSGHRSGVTIATGFDIGQYSLSQLRGMFGGGELFDLLSPYAGLRLQQAVQSLNARPLTVTRAQADRIDRVAKAGVVSTLIQRYDQEVARKRCFASGAGLVDFVGLPDEAATVIASVAFQYGPGLTQATPGFWDQITSQDWEAARANLLSFGDAYPTRRRREAEYLAPLIPQLTEASR